MRIGIIGAMKEELLPLSAKLSSVKRSIIGSIDFTQGILSGQQVTLMLSGIGKVNAAVGTALLLHRFNPDYVINTGVAGGLVQSLKPGDIVVSTQVQHHDVDATIFDYVYGQIPRMPASYKADSRLVNLVGKELLHDQSVKLIKGIIMSGDSFVHANEQVEDLKKKFPSVMAVEMEGAAIAQSCFLFKRPFLVIRSISDIVTAPESHIDYQTFLKKASLNSATLVLNLLKKIKSLE